MANLNQTYRRLSAGTEGHDYDGILWAEYVEGAHVKSELVWRCGHGHDDWKDAEKCAQDELSRRASAGSDKRAT